MVLHGIALLFFSIHCTRRGLCRCFSADAVEACRLTLVAKNLSDPSINLLALQTTLRKAWRIDFDGGHWLFSGHLVNVKQWLPNTPLHCYDFSTCDFWVQVIGLPLEWSSECMLRKAVQHLFGWIFGTKDYPISVFPVVDLDITLCIVKIFPTLD